MARYQSLSDEDLEKVSGGLNATDIVIGGYYTISGNSAIVCKYQNKLSDTMIFCKVYWKNSSNTEITNSGVTTTNYHTSDFVNKVNPTKVIETVSLENPYAKEATPATPTTPPSQPTGGVQ